MTRRAIYWLFGCAAVMAILVPINEGIAQPLPIAECSEMSCTISKEDWEKLKEYHAAVREFVKRVEQKAAQDNQALPHLMQKLQSCMAILEERKV